jgi:hypothetical protein
VAAISQLRFEGRLTIPESEILNPGEVRVDLARDFSGLKSGSHCLLLDNREGQWLPGRETFYLHGASPGGKAPGPAPRLELPNGGTEWLPLYQGALSRLGGMADGWQERHGVEMETRDWISHRLNRRLGAPTPEGERRPFLRGFYRLRGELMEVTEAQVGQPQKVGNGSATLVVLGDYRGEEEAEYLLQVEPPAKWGKPPSGGPLTGGQSWEKIGLTCGGAENPVSLSEGLTVYWQPGIGTTWWPGIGSASRPRPPSTATGCRGRPFEAITAIYLNGEATWEGAAADLLTGDITITGASAQVSARVVKDGTTHPVDIMLDIFTEVGLGRPCIRSLSSWPKASPRSTPWGSVSKIFPPVRPCGRFCGGPSMTSGLISGRSKSGPIWGRTRLMARIEWARSSQFNWVYDNLGGTPLMAAVAGKAHGATALVQADGSVRIETPNSGGGQVYFVRGVWRQETSFAWDGFWADPMDGP